MSSFPTVQLQGPQLMKQPAVTQVYQEQRTILPEPNVQISQGIDWGSIGKSATDLGINIVQGMREDEFTLKSSAMQKDQNDTERAIKAAVRVNDFASVDTIKSEYNKRTAKIIGGDPDDENFVGTNMAQRKLLNQTRGFNASLDSYLDESKFGWQEVIEEDSYSTFQIDTQRQILENPSYVDTAIEENDMLFRTISGQEDMSAPIKTVGLSASKRRLLFQIQKYGIDLRETKEKMTAAPKTVADVLTDNRQVLSFITDNLKRAKDFVDKADAIESKEDLSDEERSQALELRTKALTIQKSAYDSYRQTVGGLAQLIEREVLAGIPEDFVGPPEQLPGFDKPFSLEAMETMLQIGEFKPEDATALRNAFDAVENLNGIRDFSVWRAVKESNRKQIMSRADSILSIAKANIAKVDEGIRKAGDNPFAVNQLTFVRENLIQKLHSDLYYGSIDPMIPESYKVSRRLQEFSGTGNLFMSFVGKGNVLLPFDQAGSHEMASILSSDRFGNIGDVYLDVQKKYNAVIATTADVPRPAGVSRGGELTPRDRDSIDAFLYFSGQHPDENVTADRMQRFALIQAAKMTPVDETGYLPHLSKILSGEVKVDSTVPFDRAGFMMTPWYDHMIDMVSTAGNADDARAIISMVEKTFKADTVGDLGYTTPEPTKRRVLTLFERTGDLGTLEHLFMFSHDDTRAHILNELKPSAKISAGYIARLKGLHDRYKKDGQQASPQIFLDTVGREDRYSAETQGTVTLVENRLTALGDRKVTAGATDSEKIDDANRTFIDDKLIPAIIERLGPSFGLTEEASNMMVVKNAFKETFLRDILENASIDKATGKIDASQLDALAVTAAREISSYGYNYENGMFRRSYVDQTPKQETTLNSDIFEDNTGSDPGVKQRLPMFLAMQPAPPSFKTYSPDFVGPPEDDTEKMNLETSAYTSKKLSFAQMDAFKRMAQDKPFESLVFLSMYRSQLSNVSDEGMLNAVTATVDGMPKDNLTLLSVSAASRLIGVDALDTEYAGRLKDLAISIRSSLESKDGRYKMSVINAPNNYGNKGSHPTVRIVDDSGKVLSSMQPRQHNFNKMNESLTQYPEKDLLSVIQSGDAAEWLKKESAKEYLKKTGARFVLGEEIRFSAINPTSSAFRMVYFIEENEKNNTTEIYQARALVDADNNNFREVPSSKVLVGSTRGVKKKTQDELWSMSQPSGRSGETITGKPYWLPNDMRNTALEPGNLSIGSAVLIPDAPVSENNPVNVEIRRYKGSFYVVRKDSRDTSQHFGVLNNIEDANKYVESMKRFLSK
jgi:hypothetical protein